MRLFVLCVSLVAVGCGSSTTTTAADLAVAPSGGDLAVYSLCGHPGDTGNDKGVGSYCKDTSMCGGGQAASVCSTLMPIPQGPTFFCTLPCNPNAANPDAVCGTDASCTCLSASNPNLCGCVPNLCRVGLFG